jgi:hypothetical protein
MSDDIDPLDELAEPEDLVGKDELDEDDEMELRGEDLVDDEGDGEGDVAGPPAS